MGSKRRDVHESMRPVLAYIEKRGINEAQFAAELEIDHGRFTNWKRRGVPQGMQAIIAAKIGKPTDQYLAEIGRPTGAASEPSPRLSDDERELLPLTHDEIALLRVYRFVTLGHRMAVQNFLHAISRGKARDLTREAEWHGEERRNRQLDS